MKARRGSEMGESAREWMIGQKDGRTDEKRCDEIVYVESYHRAGFKRLVANEKEMREVFLCV